MSFSDNLPKLKPLSRSVSIVGVGVTPFRQTKEDPELNGITEGELFGYRGVDPPVEIRRVEGAQRKWCRKTSVFLSRETGMPGNFVGVHQGCQKSGVMLQSECSSRSKA